MHLLIKLKEHGVQWFVKRLVREFIQPTTSIGKYLRPFGSMIYFLINRPINHIISQVSASTKTTNTLYFFYDFEVEPITYDFAWALCIANARREELKLSHLQVVFVPGKENGLRKESTDYDQVVNQHARHWRMHAIIFPVIKLLPCPVGVVFCATRKQAMFIRAKQAQHVYPEKYNVTFPVSYAPEQAMYYQQKFVSMRADKQALAYVSKMLSKCAQQKKVIVITLREYGYMPERNSNVAAWAQFAKSLNPNTFFVIFVPDTEQALDEVPNELSDFYSFSAASWNLNLRAALYELAYLNLGVNTGPMALCWLNPNCRYLSFKTCVDNVPQASMELLISRGFVPNENPVFTHAFQKWIWQDDNFDVISHEFMLMHNHLEKEFVHDRA